MQKIVALVMGVVALVACQPKPEGYTVHAIVTGGLDEGTQVYLKTTDSLNQWVVVDTSRVENGAFRFTGEQNKLKIHYIAIAAVEGDLPFVLENGNIAITFQKDSLVYAEVTGTTQNKFLTDFLSESRKWSAQIEAVQKDMYQAAQQEDTVTVMTLQEEYVEFQEEAMDFSVAFAKENPDALISVMLMKNFLAIEFLPQEEIEAMYDALNEEIKVSPAGILLKKQLDSIKATKIGAVAPEFSAPTPDGNLLALSDVKGKLTLIDFWAAWCLPCRVENPNMVKVYQKYHHKGLNIIGVSLDFDATDWKKAIAADGLSWRHISNLKQFEDPIAECYGVNAIPATFLLDEHGRIIAKNLRGRALEEKVATLLQ